MAVLTTSCNVYRYTEARITDAHAHVDVINPSAKVDVEPVSFQDTWVFEGDELKGYKANGNITIDKLKVAASFKSLQKHGGDILVAPLFDIRSELDGRRYIVVVRAYSGKFVDWDKDGIVVESEATATDNMKMEKRVEVYTK